MSASDNRTRAFLHDLTVAPLWNECFHRLLIETVPLPDSGRVLLVECGTGGLAVELAHRLRETGTVTATDSDPARLQVARDKRDLAKLDNLRLLNAGELAQDPVADGYDLAVGDASLLPTDALTPMLALLRERAGEDGQIVAYAVSRGSFDEFFSILWQALYECNLAETLAEPLEALLHTYPTKAALRTQATAAGLHSVNIIIEKETFTFQNGQDFLESPLIAGYWLDRWLAIVPPEHRAAVKTAVCSIIDEEYGTCPFEVSIKAALLTGRTTASGGLTHAADAEDEVPESDDDAEGLAF